MKIIQQAESWERIMSDAEWKDYVSSMTRPEELLIALVDHFSAISTDPYYRDLSDHILDRAEKVLTPKQTGPIMKYPDGGWGPALAAAE